MVAIAATNSAPPTLQASLGKIRLQQALSEAARAESVAQNLRTQANDAESEAQRSHGRARALTSNVASIDPTYQVKRQPSTTELQAASPLYPAQNTQRQVIGRIVNLQA